MGGRAPKKLETARKRSAGAIDDQKWSKIARSKKKHATFASFDTNGGGLTGTKKGFPNELIALRATADTLEDNVLAFRLNLKSNAL